MKRCIIQYISTIIILSLYICMLVMLLRIKWYFAKWRRTAVLFVIEYPRKRCTRGNEKFFTRLYKYMYTFILLYIILYYYVQLNAFYTQVPGNILARFRVRPRRNLHIHVADLSCDFRSCIVVDVDCRHRSHISHRSGRDHPGWKNLI